MGAEVVEGEVNGAVVAIGPVVALGKGVDSDAGVPPPGVAPAVGDAEAAVIGVDMVVGTTVAVGRGVNSVPGTTVASGPGIAELPAEAPPLPDVVPLPLSMGLVLPAPCVGAAVFVPAGVSGEEERNAKNKPAATNAAMMALATRAPVPDLGPWKRAI